MSSFQRLIVPLLLLPLATVALQGQERRYRFFMDAGHRWDYNRSGNQDLYRSQIDLGQGPKLFASEFFLVLPDGEDRFFDRLEMRMNDWGGEPYNTAYVSFSKRGLYEFRFDYLNSQYFSSIPDFANPFFEEGNLSSQHRQALEYKNFGFHLKLLPGRRISPFFEYRRGSRDGDAVTTLAADGDEFVIDALADSHSDDIRGGVSLKLRDDLAIYLEQGFRWYRNQDEFSALGLQEGNSDRPFLGRDIVLESYEARNDFEATIPFSTGSVAYQPSDSLSLRGKLSYSLADLDTAFRDEASGSFLSFPALRILYGQGGRDTVGSAKRPSIYGDFSADWQPIPQLLIQERFTLRRFHTSGSALSSFLFSDVEGIQGEPRDDPLSEERLFDTFLATDVNTQELLAKVFVTSRFAIRGGHRFENRRLEVGSEVFESDRNLLILGASYQFSTRNSLALDMEMGVADQPTVFRTDAADTFRLRLKGRMAPLPGLAVSGSVVVLDRDNDQEDIDLATRDRTYSLQVRYAPFERFSLAVDYQRSDYDSDLLFVVPQTFQRDRSLFTERGDYGGAYLNLLLIRGTELSLGYSFWDVTGSFPQSFHRPTARLQAPLSRNLSAYLQWNSYDYQQRGDLFPQEYQVQLLTVGFRLRLGNDF